MNGNEITTRGEFRLEKNTAVITSYDIRDGPDKSLATGIKATAQSCTNHSSSPLVPSKLEAEPHYSRRKVELDWQMLVVTLIFVAPHVFESNQQFEWQMMAVVVLFDAEPEVHRLLSVAQATGWALVGSRNTVKIASVLLGVVISALTTAAWSLRCLCKGAFWFCCVSGLLLSVALRFLLQVLETVHAALSKTLGLLEGLFNAVLVFVDILSVLCRAVVCLCSFIFRLLCLFLNICERLTAEKKQGQKRHPSKAITRSRRRPRKRSMTAVDNSYWNFVEARGFLDVRRARVVEGDIVAWEHRQISFWNRSQSDWRPSSVLCSPFEDERTY